jgi:uncharacterized membrane protein
MDVGQIVAVWLHTVGFVIAWGYYGVLARMVIPELAADGSDRAGVLALAGIERRALTLIGAALLLFLVTGTYLLLTDASYQGLGNFFASTWTTLMLVKHVVVVALVAVGFGIDVLIRRAAGSISQADRRTALRGARLGAEAATGLGAVIALLTAAAQASA